MPATRHSAHPKAPAPGQPADSPTVSAYLRTKVMSAPPEQLRLMLIDGAIKFCLQGIEALKNRDWEAVYHGFTQSRNILLELGSSIGPDVEPTLASRVKSLYTYMYGELVDASFQKDAARAENVVKLLQYERETWLMLIEKLSREQGHPSKPGTSGQTLVGATAGGSLSVHA